jgi:hypothetical protein
MATRAELEDVIRRQTEALRSQADQIVQLESEITRLNGVVSGSCDALQVLQKVYSDASAPLSAVLKAAGIAVAFERTRPPSVTVNAGFSLYDLLEKKRLERMQAKTVIDAKPDPSAA